MATVCKTITLTEQQNAWIVAQIETGCFTDDSEIIGDLIRREQERHFEIDEIRQALIDGEQSGEAEQFDFAKFKCAARLVHLAGTESDIGAVPRRRPNLHDPNC